MPYNRVQLSTVQRQFIFREREPREPYNVFYFIFSYRHYLHFFELYMTYGKSFQSDTREIYRHFQIIAITAAIAHNADPPRRMLYLASNQIRYRSPLWRESDCLWRECGPLGNDCFFHPETAILRDIVKEPRRFLVLYF